MALLYGLIPAGLVAVGVIFVLAVAHWRKWRNCSDGSRRPLTEELLRPPGYSLNSTIEDASLDLYAAAILIVAAPLIGYSVAISLVHFAAGFESTLLPMATVIVVLGTVVVFARVIFNAAKKRRQYVDGLIAEQFTGRELDQTMLDGCRVFHDVPITYGNVDHVVVGESGVFAIETKSIRKVKTGQQKIVVDKAAGIIQFPHKNWKIPVDQLETIKNQLKTFLSRSTGEPVDIEVLLALPGWFIDRNQGNGSNLVFNPKNSRNLFTAKPAKLSAKRIEQIAYQLERECRIGSSED